MRKSKINTMKNLVILSMIFVIILITALMVYSSKPVGTYERLGVWDSLKNLFSGPSKEEYLIDVTELYGYLSPGMKSFVDNKLSYIDCRPTEFYYNNGDVCFVCEYDACFEYAWVYSGPEGNKMSLIGLPYLSGFAKIDVKVADFYTKGLASILNCEKKDKTSLTCDGGLRIVMEDSYVKAFLDGDLRTISKLVCDHFGYETPRCDQQECKCGNLVFAIGKVSGELYYGEE